VSDVPEAAGSGNTTPHQRRVRELEARRRLLAELQELIRSSPGSVPAPALLGAIERASSDLPESSRLLTTLDGLAARLRRAGSGPIAESGLRQVAARLRREADDLGRVIDARDAKLQAKHRGREQ
jgi:hypothetical protein